MNDTDTPDLAHGSGPVTQAFFTLHEDLPRQAPGSDATTRRLPEMAGPLPEHPRVLDAGCGPGRATLLLAEEAGAHVTAVDLHHLTRRIARADPQRPGMPEALTATQAEIAMRREHGGDYAAYLLHPYDNTTDPNGNEITMTTWNTRPETAEDIPAIRDILLAAFPTALEADLVDALRADPKAWIDGLSMVATTPDGIPVGYALITRCHVDGAPALALAPCAVTPSAQRTGAGSAAIRAALDTARAMGENLILVLGHADYYPRFGFTPASRFGIRAPFEAPDEAMMAMALDDTRPIPTGTIQYPAAFGV